MSVSLGLFIYRNSTPQHGQERNHHMQSGIAFAKCTCRSAVVGGTTLDTSILYRTLKSMFLPFFVNSRLNFTLPFDINAGQLIADLCTTGQSPGTPPSGWSLESIAIGGGRHTRWLSFLPLFIQPTLLHTIALRLRGRFRGLSCEIDSQLSTIHHLTSQELFRLLRTRYVGKVGVRETTWLAAAAINGDSNV